MRNSNEQGALQSNRKEEKQAPSQIYPKPQVAGQAGGQYGNRKIHVSRTSRNYANSNKSSTTQCVNMSETWAAQGVVCKQLVRTKRRVEDDQPVGEVSYEATRE